MTVILWKKSEYILWEFKLFKIVFEFNGKRVVHLLPKYKLLNPWRNVKIQSHLTPQTK